jgi:hypothetical protein
MQGVAGAFEQRIFKGTRLHETIEHLKKAVCLFSVPMLGSQTPSDSDLFHIAYARHLIDWLLSELQDGEALRNQTLASMPEALAAYEWLADKTKDWQHHYNIAEELAVLSAPAVNATLPRVAPARAVQSLVRAIELNPRLADFNADTKFDGIEEPLSKVPALQHVLQILKDQSPEWLKRHLNVYRRHADLYKEDVTNGIKAMRKDLKSKTLERAIVLVMKAMLFFIGSSFWLVISALAKPIFR